MFSSQHPIVISKDCTCPSVKPEVHPDQFSPDSFLVVIRQEQLPETRSGSQGHYRSNTSWRSGQKEFPAMRAVENLDYHSSKPGQDKDRCEDVGRKTATGL